jgi:hypothetical protein
MTGCDLVWVTFSALRTTGLARTTLHCLSIKLLEHHYLETDCNPGDPVGTAVRAPHLAGLALYFPTLDLG